ncbi:MAG TPA: hypothetical protein VL240_08185 [Candidatus Binatia bacterium]|nr:hypothetical protein [Candidatus Binatia bacterium]
MKLSMPVFLGAALVLGCAAPAIARPVASPQQYQSDQDRDRERNTQAYNDGYAQGQSDARGHAIRNDRAASEWTKEDDQRAYRQGYDAGYDNIMNPGSAATPADRMPRGDQQAEQFGYQDGLAAGRYDQMKGNHFKPQDHDLYKDGLHGWTTALGTKDQFKQLYREGFVRGYEEGYKGSGPR